MSEATYRWRVEWGGRMRDIKPCQPPLPADIARTAFTIDERNPDWELAGYRVTWKRRSDGELLTISGLLEKKGA